MLPTGFTAIQDAKENGSVVSLIGVIVGAKEVRRSRGSDWCLEITIQDDFTAGLEGASSINCRMFRSAPDKFPKVTGIGDVAIIRNFKLNAWGSRVDAVWTHKSGALVFPAAKIPVPELSQAYQAGTLSLPCSATFGVKDPSTPEQMAAIHLKHAASSLLPQARRSAVARPASMQVRDKLSLVKDLEVAKFYDVRAQVVNIYHNNMGTVDLKITDYTTNKDLFLYLSPEDEDYMYQDHSWKGPYGQVTINVLLYGSNATWARENLSFGDFVYLKNMRTKMSPANKLEGILHEDRQRPDQVDIYKLVKPSDIREINERKDEYEKTRTKKSAFEALKNDDVVTKPSAKASAKNKAEKKARQRMQKEQEQIEIAEKAEERELKRSGVNLNSKRGSQLVRLEANRTVRAAFPEAQLSTVSEIIYNSYLTAQTPKYNDFTFPFLNARHRARVRVVDFFPPELDMFSHSTSDPSWDKRSKNQDSLNGQPKGRWEWGFALLLEDAKVPPNTVSEKLRVVVGNDVGQYLLGMNAKE
jgi:protection-of-telomeres protein 1